MNQIDSPQRTSRQGWGPAAAARLRARWALVLLLLVGACGVVVLAAHEDGFSAQAMDLGAGSVWLASNGPGQMALLDGASGEVTVKLRVANDGDDVVAVTGHGAGYAVNRTTGTVLRVDAATWNTSDDHVMIDGSTGGLTAIAGEQALFATDVQRGLVVRADPRSLEPDGVPRSLSAVPGIGSPVLDRRGVLWLLDAEKGNLIRMTDVPETVQTGIADGASGRLVLANDRPAVVDLAAGRVTPIDPETGHSGSPACVDVDPNDATVRVVGDTAKDQVYAVSGSDGVLRITNLDTGDCTATVPDIAAPGADLGQPVEAAQHLFVPDYSTGQVIVINLDRQTHTTTAALADPGSTFELIARDGFAFYNERTSNKAGVIDTDGSVRSVAKYDVEDPGKGVHLPEPTPSPPQGPENSSTTVPTEDTAAPPSTDRNQSSGIQTAEPGNDSTSTVGQSVTQERSAAVSSAAAAPTPSSTNQPGSLTTPSQPPTTPQAPTGAPSSTSGSSSDSETLSPSSTPDSSTPQSSTPESSTGLAPQVDSIDITSFPNDGRFLNGDVLTFGASVSGGTPDTWSWTLKYADDDGNPHAAINKSSSAPTFSSQVDSGGPSFQNWFVDVKATNAAGTGEKTKVIKVEYADGRPFEVVAVKAAPNPVVTGTPMTVSPIFQGASYACEWWIENASQVHVTPTTSCDAPQTAPAIGPYTVLVSATSRQNTSATGSQPLTVKNIDPPVVSACSAPSNVGAHDNAAITAAASGIIENWHWVIQRGNPLQPAGFEGSTAGTFSFVPVVADSYQTEVWVSNAGGDSAHQTCAFTVADRTPPDSHTISRQEFEKSERFTMTASDPESVVTDTTLTVTYHIVSGCTHEDSPAQSATKSATSGSVSMTIQVGSCLDTSPGAPVHTFNPNTLVVNSYASSAKSSGGTSNWTG